MAEVRDVVLFNEDGIGLSNRKGWTGFLTEKKFFEGGLKEYSQSPYTLTLDDDLSYLYSDGIWFFAASPQEKKRGYVFYAEGELCFDSPLDTEPRFDWDWEEEDSSVTVPSEFLT